MARWVAMQMQNSQDQRISSEPTPDDTAEVAQLDDFKKGLLTPIERQAVQAKACQQLLSSVTITQDERNRMGDMRSEIDKILSEIQGLVRQIISDLNQGNLYKDSQKDYHNFFKGDFTDHRMSFIIFLRTYLLLKRAALDLSDRWSAIKRLLGKADLAETSEFRNHFVNFRMGPSLVDCQAMNVFADRMSRILMSEGDLLNARTLAGKVKYVDGLNYQVSTVFTPNLNVWLRTFDKTVDDPNVLGAVVQPLRKAKKLEADDVKLPQAEYFLNAGGTQHWNSGSHYNLQFDPAALEGERLQFAEVIQIDTHMGAEQDLLRSNLVLNYSRKSVGASPQDLEKEYSKFLFTFMSLITDITLLNLGIPAKHRTIFLFHVGPHSYYFLVRRFLQEFGTGYLHRKLSRSGAIQKIVPGEFIKKALIDWWKTEILGKLGPEKDDLGLYKSIVRLVKENYDKLSAKAMAEYNALPEDVKAMKNRNDLIRENLHKWLGTTNILIFKRFLKT